MSINLSLDEIKKLYYQDGLSASVIASKHKATVWQIIKFMKKHNLPRRAPHESNSLRYERQKPSFNLKSTLSIADEKLKLAALMLYWAEGVKGKRVYTVDFVNSDPKMIMIFLKFLRNICRVDQKRLRVLLYCYANQNVEKLLNYWSNLTNIPKGQFIKPYVRQDFNPNGRKMINGLVHIRYNDKKLFEQIIRWIEEIKEL